MSTAIFRTFTSEGFVILADGRRKKANDGSVVCDTVKKIFSIEDQNKCLGYALAGAVYNGNAERVGFDFSVEADKAAQALIGRNPGDLTRYAQLFSGIINDSLLKAVSTGQLQEYPTVESKSLKVEPGNTIANLFFIGYYEGVPSWTDVRFWHEKQGLKKPSIFSERIRINQMKISGSERISDLLFNKRDQRFSSYIVDAPDFTLTDAIKVGKNYILACCDPLAQQIDPECSTIGGQIHAATLTKEEGFKWFPGLEPVGTT
jgi:hypothetical protein